MEINQLLKSRENSAEQASLLQENSENHQLNLQQKIWLLGWEYSFPAIFLAF